MTVSDWISAHPRPMMGSKRRCRTRPAARQPGCACSGIAYQPGEAHGRRAPPAPVVESAAVPSLSADVVAVFVAKTARTFCYGFLGIVLPLYLADLGMTAAGIGTAVTLTLAGSAILTWAIRRPAERLGPRAPLLALSALSAASALLLLGSAWPPLVVLAAVLGNVAVGTGETGPFLTIEQVVIARVVTPDRRTQVLGLYNFLGYAAGAVGAATVGLAPGPRALFLAFLAAALVQALAYSRLPALVVPPRPRAAGGTSSAPLIRRFAALFALDSFAGGFVVQSLVSYYLYQRYDLGLEALGLIFGVAQILTAISILVTAWVAARLGLLATMVVSHLISNVFLIGVAFAPTAGAAIALIFLRQLLSQMDVPTRQAYVMAVVADHEREAAAALPNLWRTVAQAITPSVTGWVMQSVALSAPFVLGGGLKIVYDVLIWLSFRKVKLRE
jgi:MFS family permease